MTSSNDPNRSSQGNGDISLDSTSGDECAASSKRCETTEAELEEIGNLFHIVKSRFFGIKSKYKKNASPKLHQKPIQKRATRHMNIEVRYTYDTIKRDATAKPPIALCIGPSPALRDHIMKVGRMRPLNFYDTEVPCLVHTHKMSEKILGTKYIRKGYISAKDIRNQNLRARNMVAGGIYKNDRYYATNMPVIEIGRTPITFESDVPEVQEREVVQTTEANKPKEPEKANEPPPVVQNMSAESMAPEGFGQKVASSESMAPETLGKEPSASDSSGKEGSEGEGGKELEKKKSGESTQSEAESTQSEDSQSIASEVISSSYRLETSQSGFSDNLLQDINIRQYPDDILSSEISFGDSTISKDSTTSVIYKHRNTSTCSRVFF